MTLATLPFDIISSMLPILQQSYWRDEAFSVLLSSKSLEEILLLTIKDVHPPFYYFLLHFWIKLFGDAEYVTRSLSLLFHFLLVLSSFFLLKHLLKNWKISLLGCLGILFNPFLIEYAFETRAYTFFTFLIVSATLFYLKRKWLTFSLFAALAVLTHNFSVFFLVAFGANWLSENKRHFKERFVEFSKLFTLPILTLLGWSFFLWNQWTKVAGGFWIEPKTSSLLIDSVRAFFMGVKDYPSRGMSYNLAITLIFLGLSYWVADAVNQRNKETLEKNLNLLVFLFSIPFLIVYVISSFWVPIYHERFLMPVLPIFIVWIVYSLFKFSVINKSFSYFIFAVGLAYVLFSVQGTEEIMRKTTKPAINYGVSQVLAKASGEYVIVPESVLNFLETKYYVKKSGRNIPVYAYLSDGKIPFYVGAVLFTNEDLITEYPQDKNVWVVKPDGGFYFRDNQLIRRYPE